MLKSVLCLFLLISPLFQHSEAKRKKHDSGGISEYIVDIRDFFADAWEALLDLVPSFSETTKKKSKKNPKNNYWDLNYYMKSASNYFSSSMDMLQMGGRRSGGKKSAQEDDADMEQAFFVELFAAEILENITWGLMNIISNVEDVTVNKDNKS